MTSQAGLCSIIMPCYNRAGFLPEALAAIRAQTFTGWELIIVDDGSADETAAVLPGLLAGITQTVRSVRQENAGAYAARNTGLDHARGEFIAFYDSDDLWLPHHLADAMAALHNHPELDWVYADARKIDFATGKVVVDRGFHEGGHPHPMLGLHTRSDERSGQLRIFDDPGVVACGLRNNLCCLLQTSVIRSRVFEGRRFDAAGRNEGEDELFPLRAIKAGFRLGYLDDIHVVYRMHSDNASSSAVGVSAEKRLRITAAAARGYEDLAGQVPLTPAEQRALGARLANEYFWKRGYAVFWPAGRLDEAFAEFRRGLANSPHDWRMWKTYFFCRLRAVFRRGGRRR